MIGSKFPISDGTDNFEEFTIEADNAGQSVTLDRTIPDTSITLVQHKYTDQSRFICLTRDVTVCRDAYGYKGYQFIANAKKIYLKDAIPGTLRVSYDHAAVIMFTQEDYDLEDANQKQPTWLGEIYHNLLWLQPAYNKALKFNPEKAKALEPELKRIEEMFFNEFYRNTEINAEFTTDDFARSNRNNGGLGGNNHR